VIHSPPIQFTFSNPWFSWSYVADHTHDILAATRAHVTLTLLAVGIGFAASIPLTLLARRAGWLRALVLGVANAAYAVPSLAAVVALFPVFGLAIWTVVVPLAAYTLVIFVRNMLTGLDEVSPETLDAARGMGFGAVRLFLRVRVPLALPAIMAGLRLATVSTIELVVIGGFIGQDGYGQYIFQGFRDNYRAQITTYIILTILLALVADLVIISLERLLTPWKRRRTA
jgi:osmoprotectant transport system permease protein